MNKDWADYQDIWGLVQQKGGDQGDTLNRSCAKQVLCLLGKGYGAHSGTVFWRLSNGKGKYRRSSDNTKWHGQYDRTSRDQLTPLVILAGLLNRDELWLIFKDHLKRGLLFAYNTRRNFVYKNQKDHLERATPDVPWNYSWKLPDLTGPEFWALYIRGFRAWYLYPVLYLCDLHTLLGSAIIRGNEQDDVINHALVLEYSQVRMPTLFSTLACRITPKALLQERLDKFFGPEQEPPLNELYKELL